MTFLRPPSALALVVTFLTIARADVSFTENNGDGSDMTVVKMTVTRAAEPSPALKHRLVAREMELKPGNAAPYYYRAQLELGPTMKSIRAKYNEVTQLGRWYGTGDDATPIAQLPLDKVRDASQMFDSIYNAHLKPAFERADCDWQLNVDELRGPELISIHLAEFQNSREIARMLALRTRLAIAEKRYDDAAEHMRENYRLGHDVTKVPFLVCGLIGIAIDGITNRTLVEMIASPNSPNMYWALGELPQPPVDLRPAVRFEMDFGPRVFPLLHNAATTDHSPDEWNRLFVETIRDLQYVGGAPSPFPPNNALPGNVTPGLAATAMGLIGYTHAKERLIADGLDAARVEQMSVGQVIAIYSERNYRRFADHWETLWQVPYAESIEMARRLEKELDAAKPTGGGKDREILPMGTLLLPALQASRSAQTRLDREVASLRVIEAIRMYAAEYDGRLPARLEDIDKVPVPSNPATGKPFMYWVDGETANLQLPASDRISGGNVRYEIRIAKQK